MELRKHTQKVQDRPVPFIPAPKWGQERHHPTGYPSGPRGQPDSAKAGEGPCGPGESPGLSKAQGSHIPHSQPVPENCTLEAEMSLWVGRQPEDSN